jgi:hypothetical protein
MATAARLTAPTADVDDGWRDIIASAPPPPPSPPRDAFGATVPADVVQSGRRGCVASIQLAEPERPSFDAGDRRMWLVAGALMTLATCVLGLLGLLTYKQSAATATAAMATSAPANAATASTPTATPASAAKTATATPASAAKTATATPASATKTTLAERTPAIAAGSIGTARPLNVHALRHAKHARKHRKLASR